MAGLAHVVGEGGAGLAREVGERLRMWYGYGINTVCLIIHSKAQ